MFRSIHPRQQAVAIEAFVQTLGARAKHAEVLELVARLNGAPHYNALVAATGSGRPDALTRRIKGWLVARFERLAPVIEAWTPAAVEPAGRALPEALAALMFEAGQGAASEREANRRIAEALAEAKRHIAEFEDQAYKAAGFNRVLPVPTGAKLLSVRASLYNEDDSAFEFLVDGDPVRLTFGQADEDGESATGLQEGLDSERPSLLERILERAVLAEAIVHYPRADRYGVPEEATNEGARAWAWAEGFAVTADFEGTGEDSGDDTPAWADLGLWVRTDDFEALRVYARCATSG